jgi:hypothetical protein
MMIYCLVMTPPPMQLFGLEFDPPLGVGGAALFAPVLPLPISIEDRLEGLFVLGSDWPLGGGGFGAWFFPTAVPWVGFFFAAAAAATVCLQLACVGVHTIPLMMTPLRIVSFFTLRLLSDRTATDVGGSTLEGVGDMVLGGTVDIVLRGGTGEANLVTISAISSSTILSSEDDGRMAKAD